MGFHWMEYCGFLSDSRATRTMGCKTVYWKKTIEMFTVDYGICEQWAVPIKSHLEQNIIISWTISLLYTKNKKEPNDCNCI